MAGQIPQGHEHSGWPKLSPMDWRRRPVHLACTPEGDQPLLKPPKVTSGAREYSVQVTSLGQLAITSNRVSSDLQDQRRGRAFLFQLTED
jgi:hypothetical protein